MAARVARVARSKDSATRGKTRRAARGGKGSRKVARGTGGAWRGFRRDGVATEFIGSSVISEPGFGLNKFRGGGEPATLRPGFQLLRRRPDLSAEGALQVPVLAPKFKPFQLSPAVRTTGAVAVKALALLFAAEGARIKPVGRANGYCKRRLHFLVLMG